VPFPRAYLAVDVFFVLSGFVIAYAYQHRLDSGMPVRRYFLARLVRLYPLYIFATLLGAAWIAQGLLRQGSIEALGPWALALAGAALFLPDPLGARALFPLNEPAWSLFFELLVNLLYGALAVRLSNRILGALILAGAALLGFAIAQMGTLNVGFDWDNAAWGSGRALFSFFVGVGVFRCRQRHRLTAVPIWLVSLVLLASFVPSPGRQPWFYDLACIVVLYPLLVWTAADASAGRAMIGLSRRLGYLSYPLYALHWPLGLILASLARHGIGVTTQASPILAPLVHFGAVIGVAWLVARSFDTPVRARLKRRYRLSADAPAQTAP